MGAPTRGHTRASRGTTTLARLDLLPLDTEAYGTSTPACQGAIDLQVNSNPTPGNQTFEVICNDAPPNVPIGALLFGVRANVPLPLLNTNVWLTPVVLGLPATTTSTGAHRMPLPIPVTVPVGTQVSCQYFWLNTTTCAGSGPLSASNALELTM